VTAGRPAAGTGAWVQRRRAAPQSRPGTPGSSRGRPGHPGSGRDRRAGNVTGRTGATRRDGLPSRPAREHPAGPGNLAAAARAASQARRRSLR